MANRFPVERISGFRKQRGQVMVLFALLLPVLLGMAGLGIDSAHLFQTRREVQSAADLAALAAASQLPDDPGAAREIAEEIAAENGFSGGSVAVTVPYDGDDGQIEVVITEEVGLFFMPALGIPSVTLSARSVAIHEVTGDGAVFAKKDYHCWNEVIYWKGSNIMVNGNVHSNGGLTLSGSGNTATRDLTYKVGEPTYPVDGQQSCEPDVYVTGNNTGIEVKQTSWRDWPILYSPTDFPCTFDLETDGNLERPGDWWVGGYMSDSYRLNPGIICYNGDGWLTLDESNVTGNVTFRAKQIDIGGLNTNFTAYSPTGVLFFSDGTSFPTMVLNPQGGRWEGMIYNRSGNPSDTYEGGQIVLNGSSGFEHVGSILGWAVTLDGSNWSISGPDLPVYSPMRIVE